MHALFIPFSFLGNELLLGAGHFCFSRDCVRREVEGLQGQGGEAYLDLGFNISQPTWPTGFNHVFRHGLSQSVDEKGEFVSGNSQPFTRRRILFSKRKQATDK